MAVQTALCNVNIDEIGFCFIAISTASNACYRSDYGYQTWVNGGLSVSQNWSGMACGDGIAVFIANGSTINNLMFDRQVTATVNGNPMISAAAWSDLAYAGGYYVGVATGGTISTYMSFVNGVLWTAGGALPASSTWNSISGGDIGGTKYFLAATSTTANFAYSTNNGISWTAGTAFTTTGNWKIRYGNQGFMALNVGTTTIAYSSDGRTWTYYTLPATASDLVYAPSLNQWQVVPSSGTATAYSTNNGISWTAKTLPSAANWLVAFGKTIDGFQMFVGFSVSNTVTCYSYDGQTWYPGAAIASSGFNRFFWVPLSWSSNDSLNVSNNAVVTFNTDQKKAMQAITVNAGQLNIVNASTSSANRFVMGSVATARSITPYGLGSINIAGNWISIGTGTGVAGQTLTAPYRDYVPAIWVETSAGSGIYEQWLNVQKVVGYSLPVWRKEGLNNVANGRHGHYFTQTPAPTANMWFTVTGSSTYASKFVTVSSTANILVGAHLVGLGIVSNTMVEQVVSSTILRLNYNTTILAGPNTWTIYNPFGAQTTSTLTFGDGTHGNVIPAGANVRIPNIMVTDITGADSSVSGLASCVGFNMTNAGKFYADTCLFSECYGNFTQATVVRLNNVGLTYMFQITKSPSVNMTNFGIANSPLLNYLSGNIWNIVDRSSYSYECVNLTYCPGAVIDNVHIVNYGGSGITGTAVAGYGNITFANGCDGSIATNILHAALLGRAGGPTVASYYSSNTTFSGVESYGNSGQISTLQFGSNLLTYNVKFKPGYLNESPGWTASSTYVQRLLYDGGLNLLTPGKYYVKLRQFHDWGTGYQAGHFLDMPAQSFQVWNDTQRGRMAYAGACGNGVNNNVQLWFYAQSPISAAIPAFEIYRSTSSGFSIRDATTLLSRQNYNVSTLLDAGANLLAAPITGTTYFYVVRKYIGQLGLASCTVSSGSPNLTTTTDITNAFVVNSVNGTVGTNILSFAGMYGYSTGFAVATVGQPVTAPVSGIPVFATSGSSIAGTTFTVGTLTSGTILVGMLLSGPGIAQYQYIQSNISGSGSGSTWTVAVSQTLGASAITGNAAIATISDDGMIVTLTNNLTATLQGVNVRILLTPGMVVYHANLPPDTRILSITGTTTMVLTKNATALISAASCQVQTGYYETPEFEASPYVITPTTNLVLYSNDQTAANWTKTNLTVTANVKWTTAVSSQSAVTGSSTYALGDRVYSLAATGTSTQSIATSIGVNYTLTMWFLQEVTTTQPDNSVTGSITLGTNVQAFTASSATARLTMTFTATATSTPVTLTVNSNGTAFAVTNTTVTTNYLTTASTSMLTIGMPISFTGTVFGNIVAGTIYYVKLIVSATQFTVGATFNVDMTLVASFALLTASGSMAGILATSMIVEQIQVETTATWTGMPNITTTTSYTFTPYGIVSLYSYVKNQYSGTAFALNAPATTNLARYLEVFIGTTSSFTPSESNMVFTTYGNNANVCYANTGTNIVHDTIYQDAPYGIGGYSTSLCAAANGAVATFRNLTIPINGRKITVLDVATGAPVVTMTNCGFNWPQNYNSISPILTANSTKNLTIKNVRSNLYDLPQSILSLNTSVRGLFGGSSGPGPIVADPRWLLGSSVDGDATSYVAVYDSNFIEMYTGTTTGILRLNFTESLQATKPYTILGGAPLFDDTGKLYFYNPGDSIEFIWDHIILGVTGFQGLMPRLNTVDLGTDVSTGFFLGTQYSLNTGSGYGTYKDLTVANLLTETVSATTGFGLKIKFTAYAGMKIITQTSLFVLNETINGLTSGATARVIAIENNNSQSNTDTILLDTIVGRSEAHV